MTYNRWLYGMMGGGAPTWFAPWLSFFGLGIAVLVVWSVFWKGLALWHSGRRGEPWWFFVIMLVVNTLGILEIVYLFAVAKRKSRIFFRNDRMKVFRTASLVGLIALLGVALQAFSARAQDSNVRVFSPAANFPAGGTYTIGSSTASYAYAPAIPEVTVGGDFRGTFDTFLGQFQKYIYFEISHWPGSVGRWDISDPMNPKGPDKRVDFGNDGDVLSNNVVGNGPISGYWRHAVHYSGASVAEAPDGEARMMARPGIQPSSGQISIAMQFPVGSVPTFGQQLSPKYDSGMPSAAFAASSGKFFDYQPESTVNSIQIYDMTDLSGSPGEPYLASIGSIGWPSKGAYITNIPGRTTQFLVGYNYVSAGSGAQAGSAVRIAELDPDTGKPISGRQKTITLKSPFDSPQSFTVAGKTYFLAVDNPVFSDSDNIKLGNVDLGLYTFDPQAIALTRIGKITLSNVHRFVSVQYKAISSAAGDAYPVLAVPNGKGNATYRRGMTELIDDSAGLNIYALKPLLSGGNVSPSPSITIPPVPIPDPLKSGDVTVAAWPYQGVLKASGNNVNLYIYRNALQYNGFVNFDSLFLGYPFGNYSLATYGLNDAVGNPSIRVDRIDVTNLVGQTSSTTFSGTTPTPVVTPTPPSGVPVPPPPITNSQCIEKYRNLCDQITTLQQQLCKLSPIFSFCK